MLQQMCFAPLKLGLLDNDTVCGPQNTRLKKGHCFCFLKNKKFTACAILCNNKLMHRFPQNVKNFNPNPNLMYKMVTL